MNPVKLANVTVNLPFASFEEFRDYAQRYTDVEPGTPETVEFKEGVSLVELPSVLWGDYVRAAQQAGLTLDQMLSILVFFGAIKLVEMGIRQGASIGN